MRPPRPSRPPGPGRARLAKLLRYATVSGISTVTGLTVLAVLVTAGMSPGWANVVAIAVGTVPSFELNRRWVWNLDTRRSATRQMVPFLLWCFIELVGSTLAVHLAAGWAGHHQVGPERTGLVEAANVAAFGSFWVAQHLLLDKVLFGHRRPGTPPEVPSSGGPVGSPGAGEPRAASGARA